MSIAWHKYPLQEDVADFELPVLRDECPSSDILIRSGDHAVTLKVAACNHPGSTLRWGLLQQPAIRRRMDSVGYKFEELADGGGASHDGEFCSPRGQGGIMAFE